MILDNPCVFEIERIFTDVCNTVKGFLESMKGTPEDGLRQSDAKAR